MLYIKNSFFFLRTRYIKNNLLYILCSWLAGLIGQLIIVLGYLFGIGLGATPARAYDKRHISAGPLIYHILYMCVCAYKFSLVKPVSKIDSQVLYVITRGWHRCFLRKQLSRVVNCQ